MKRRELLFTATAGLVLVVAALFPAFAEAQGGTPSGNGIVPIPIDDNPTCASLADLYDFGSNEKKVESVEDGTYYSLDNYLAVTIDVYDTPQGQEFNWTSNVGVDAVFVKGGPSGNLYLYNEATSDTALHAQLNSDGSGKWYGLSHISFCYNYNLDVKKDAAGSYNRTITWTLVKSVAPESHTGFIGDSFQSTWIVTATKNVVLSNYKVTGNITIYNPAPFAVSFTVSDVIDGSIPATVTCPAYTVAAGQTLYCTYEADEADGIDGTQTSNEVVVTSLTAGVDGDSDIAAIIFTANVIGDESVTVDDDRDTESQFPAYINVTTIFDYVEPFTCSTNKGDYIDGVDTDNYPNTATAKGDNTDLSSSADVDVTCYLWSVDKTANGTYQDKYRWEISKTVAPTTQSGLAGATLEWEWRITWHSIFVQEINHAVSGVITVHNPATIPLTVAVTDALTGGIPAVVTCNDADSGTFLTIGAGADGTCNYTAAPSSKVAENTATATRNGYWVSKTVNVNWVQGSDVGKDAAISDSSHAAIPVGSDQPFTYPGEHTCSHSQADYNADGTYSGYAENTATITWTGGSDSSYAKTEYTCYWPDFTVTKECFDEPVSQDGPAFFEVVLTNTGAVPLSVTLDEPLADSFGTPIGQPIALGVGASLTAYVKIGDLDLDDEFSGLAEVDNTIIAIGSYDGPLGTWEAERSDDASCRVGSRVDLLKLTNGGPSAVVWDFKIYEGPDGFGGTEVASDATPPELLDFNKANLDPLETYTICELGVPAGYNSVWHIDTDGDGIGDVAVTPYNPDADLNPPEDNGHRCVDFGFDTSILLEAGKTLHFVVDNQSPGGAPRTPGYWKNWNWCSNGKQQYTATKNGGWEAGFWLLEDVLDQSDGGAIVWDDILPDDAFEFPIASCEVAVDILDKRLVGKPGVVGDGKKVASDPFHNLATHLLAAQLNFGAGACTTPDVLEAALEAEKLLDEYNFNGNGHDPLPKKSADGTRANQLAGYLDQYNNGMFCGDTDANMTIQPVG